MKYLLFLIMIFCSAVYSQGGTSYYLDGKPIDISKTFLDPSNIQEIDASKNSLSDETINIIRRNTESEILVLSEFAARIKKNSKRLNNAGDFNVVIDDKLIADWDSYQIETSCLTEIKTIFTESSDPQMVDKPSLVLTTNCFKPEE